MRNKNGKVQEIEKGQNFNGEYTTTAFYSWKNRVGSLVGVPITLQKTSFLKLVS